MQNIHNLAKAVILLDEQINITCESKAQKGLAELFEIDNALRAILHLNANWLKGEKGILWHHWQQTLGEIKQPTSKSEEKKEESIPSKLSETELKELELTQENLLQEAKKAQQDRFRFINEALEQLLKTISKLKKEKLAEYSELVTQLETCISAVLTVNNQRRIYGLEICRSKAPEDKDIKSGRVYLYQQEEKIKYAVIDHSGTVQRKEVKLEESVKPKDIFEAEEQISTPVPMIDGYRLSDDSKSADERAGLDLEEFKNLYDNNAGVYRLAKQLRARYVPISQTLDPTKGLRDGEVKGYCYGHVIYGGKEIAQKGKQTSLLTVNVPVLKHQVSQREDRKNVGTIFEYSDRVERREAIEGLCSYLTDESVYV